MGIEPRKFVEEDELARSFGKGFQIGPEAFEGTPPIGGYFPDRHSASADLSYEIGDLSPTAFLERSRDFERETAFEDAVD